MLKDYLLPFIIGSSWPASIIFFYGTSNINPDLLNYPYSSYTFLAPVYLGLINVLAAFLGKQLGLSLRQQLFLGSMIGYLTIVIVINTFGTIKLEEVKNKWKFFGCILMAYLIVYNIIIYWVTSNIIS